MKKLAVSKNEKIARWGEAVLGNIEISIKNLVYHGRG
jgi:hypothetical protein